MITLKRKFYLLAIMVVAVFSSCQDYDNDTITITEDGMNILEEVVPTNEESDHKLAFIYKSNGEEAYVKMDAEVINGQLNSTLYYKEAKGDWSTISAFEMNLLDDNYKDLTNFAVAAEANLILLGKDQINITKIEQIVNEIPEVLLNTVGEDSYGDQTSLSVFYHLGALKSAKRAVNMDVDICQCSEFSSYLSGEAPFFCSEDKMTSVVEARELLLAGVAGVEYAGKVFTAERTFAYLNSLTSPAVSASDLDAILKQDFDKFWNYNLSEEDRAMVKEEKGLSADNDSRFYYPCWIFCVVYGSDCGCCGNYSGYCYYCHWACYVHDYQCAVCTPSWYCLPGCVPSGC